MTEPTPTTAEAPMAPPLEDAWWRDQQFSRWWIPRLRKEIFDSACNGYASVISAYGADTDASVLDAMRSDVVVATRWQAGRDAITELARRLYGWVLDAGWLAPGVAFVVVTGHGPGWLSATLAVLGVLACAPAGIYRLWSRDAGSSTLIDTVIMVAGVALLAATLWPSGGWPEALARSLWMLVWVSLALAVPGLVMLAVHRALSTGAYGLLRPLALVVVTGVAGYAALEWMPSRTVLSLDVGDATSFIVVGSAAVGLTLAAIELVNQLVCIAVDSLKLRFIAAEEYVQSCIWALEVAPSDGVGDQDDAITARTLRAELAQRLEWLAGLLEVHVPQQLTRADAASATRFTDLFCKRAAVLRTSKQRLVLGDDEVLDGLPDLLWSSAVLGARRRWVRLPEGDAASFAAPTQAKARAAQLVSRFGIVGVPAGGAAVAAFMEQQGLAGTLVVTALFLLLEIVRPGSGAELSAAAGQVPHVGRK